MPLHQSCVADLNAPTFDADWQRRAFGVTVALSEFGHYPWDAFQQRLIATIRDWEAAPAAERGDWQYYDHWFAALQRVLVDHGLLAEEELTTLDADLPGTCS